MTDASGIAHPPSARPTLALVQHGHQHLITDGYDNHEGLSEVLQAFSSVLSLHLRYRVPLNLHLSGTLLEAAAWGAPAFFNWVRALRDEGLVEIMGSAYSQPVLTLFSVEHNHRQLSEHLDLLRRHLGIDPAEVRGFWVPERVWHTERLAHLIRDPELANGGYDWVLLDDRVLYSRAGGEHSERARFDRTTAPGRRGYPPSAVLPPGVALSPEERWLGDGRHQRPWHIEGGSGLAAAPISGDLRYAIPPRDANAWRLLRGSLAAIAAAGPGAIAVYADDLEKSAAVGAWTSGAWRRQGVDAYEDLLRWLAASGEVETVLLSGWLEANPPRETRPIEPGTFYELSNEGAGDDYQGWWGSAVYAPYRRHLEAVETALATHRPPDGRAGTVGRNGSSGGATPVRRPAGGSPAATAVPEPHGLVELAWKQLMAATYETAWHGLGAAPDEVAPWARATASHARSALVTLAADAWRCGSRGVDAWVADVDADGQDEVVLANGRLFAVISPRYGGRLVSLFDLDPAGGRQMVGNPADDWNWQEELNQAMAVPDNHPGAFVDAGHENEPWMVASVARRPGGVEVQLRHIGATSSLFGSVKRYRLAGDGACLEVAYRFNPAPEHFAVEFGLSPDYLRLLREGPVARPVGQGRTLGFAVDQVQVWVDLPAGEPLVWEPVGVRPAGHVLRLRAAAWRPSFLLRLGVGAVPGDDIDLRAAALRSVTLPASSTPGEPR